MWLCRLGPTITWALLLGALFSDTRPHGSLTVADILLLASLFIYLPLVYYVLPVFLCGGNSPSVAWRIGYFIFTGVTAGIGPVVWYFVSVDGVLRRMAEKQK